MPKTTPSKKKPAARTRAASTTRTSKKVTKTPVRSRAKQAAKPKGVKHHAKRLYHLTPKFVHGMVAGALVGLVTVGILGIANLNPIASDAAGKCDAHGIGKRTMTHHTNNSAYKINGNKTTVTFNVVGKNCKLPVTMVVWKAPNGTTGKPYAAQTLYYHVTKTFGTGRHSMTGNLPACYFQVDTVTGTKLTGSTGKAFNYNKRQVAFMHGGTTSCVKKPTPPPAPPKPTYARVCDTTTKKIVDIPTSQLTNPRYTKDLTKCDTPPVIIEVCDLKSFDVVKIDQDDFDAANHTKDLTKCDNPPVVVPPEAPPAPDEPVEEVPEELVEVGPMTNAILTIAVMSIAGGIIFHKYHHHRKGTYLKNGK